LGRPADKSTARACIFCGAHADSKEHLLPRWLQDVLPSDDLVVHFREIGSREAERREWERKPFREKTRFVCEACNGGWMSRLESESKPLLAPAIARTGSLRLAPASQAIAATWAIKTVLVFQGTQADEPMAPADHFSHVRENERPPPGVTVWIGSHYRSRFDPINSVYVQKPLSLEALDDRLSIPEGPFGYFGFLAVGGVSFLVIGHRYRNRVVMSCREPIRDAVTKIWPVSTPVVVWPPDLMMDRQLIDVLFLRSEPPVLEVQVFGTEGESDTTGAGAARSRP
jgi:hypothetical protein